MDNLSYLLNFDLCVYSIHTKKLNNAEKRVFKFGSVDVELMPLATELQSHCLGLATEDYKIYGPYLFAFTICILKISVFPLTRPTVPFSLTLFYYFLISKIIKKDFVTYRSLLQGKFLTKFNNNV